MSHYAVLHIGNRSMLEIDLAPFDENIEVEPYVDETKDEIVANRRATLKQALNLYEEHHHISAERAAELEAELKLSDEELYSKCIYSDDTLTPEGHRLSTYNPDSRWDYYRIGGRWSGRIPVAAGATPEVDFLPDMERGWDTPEDLPAGHSNQVRIGAIADLPEDFSVYAMVVNRRWIGQGRMGWFGMSTDEVTDEQWRERVHATIAEAKEKTPNLWATILDLHI